ncbi:hypothetical protein N8639_00255 [bacterium]|nr:hypothetical protein [bacterium]
MQKPTLTDEESKSDKGRELLAICHSISNDGELRLQGFRKLQDWLGQNSKVGIPAVTFIHMLVKQIAADKKITKTEGRELFAAINYLCNQNPLANESFPVQVHAQLQPVKQGKETASCPKCGAIRKGSLGYCTECEFVFKEVSDEKIGTVDNYSVEKSVESAVPTLGWQGYRAVQFNLLIGRPVLVYGLLYLFLSFFFLGAQAEWLRGDPKDVFVVIQNVFFVGGTVAVCLGIMIGYFEVRSFKRIRLKLYGFEIESGTDNEHKHWINYYSNTSLGKHKISRLRYLSLCRIAQMPWPNASDLEIDIQGISRGSFKPEKDVEFECGATRMNLLFRLRWLWKQDTNLWEPFIPVDSPQNSTSTK